MAIGREGNVKWIDVSFLVLSRYTIDGTEGILDSSLEVFQQKMALVMPGSTPLYHAAQLLHNCPHLDAKQLLLGNMADFPRVSVAWHPCSQFSRTFLALMLPSSS